MRTSNLHSVNLAAFPRKFLDFLTNILDIFSPYQVDVSFGFDFLFTMKFENFQLFGNNYNTTIRVTFLKFSNFLAIIITQ